MRGWRKFGLLILCGSAYLLVINRWGTEMNIAQKIAQFAAYQRTVRELTALSGRQLTDLGITRADIKSLARANAF